MSLITILKEYFPIIGEVPLTGAFKVLMKQQDYFLCGLTLSFRSSELLASR